MASPSSTHPWKYDVFLSFRGDDTRRTIVSHLHSGLQSKGITVFIDDQKLHTGDSISNELAKAIEESRFAVVVISENYASSSWCLDELEMIMECKKKGILTVAPIFYEVDPSDVRNQKGTFAKAFEKYDVPEMAEKVQKWRKALSEVASLVGVDSRTCPDEATMVHEIVGDISARLFSILPRDSGDIIGMEAHLEALASLLSTGSNGEVCMIGVWGMGGIGKTTIAKCLYNKLLCQFQFHCFMGNIKKISSEHGLEYLQGRFLSGMLREENLRFQSLELSSNAIEARLHNQKVLAILDDVDQLDQLCALAKEAGWFGPGSIIIITTRDKGLLIAHNITLVHEVKCLEDDVALKLFNHFAFRARPMSDQFMRLSVRASNLVRGLPLALKVFGSFLCGRTIEEWEIAIRKLRGDPRKIIMESLKVSYDGLDERDKVIFVSAACFFNEECVSHVAKLLDGEELEVSNSLKRLAEKSLVDISKDGYLVVHDLIQEMAKEIVYQQSTNDPRRRRFLWDAMEIYDVLVDGTGTSAVEGMLLNLCQMEEFPMDFGALKNMRNLKFLKIYNTIPLGVDISQILAAHDCLPRRLRLLDWSFCPLTTLPSTFRAKYLVELRLRFSNLHRLWERTLALGGLRRIDLSWSIMLEKLPDLSGARNLEELDLSYCSSLLEVPSSFPSLKKLTKLSMKSCSKLEFLPSSTGLTSLKLLNLRGCVNLKSFPELYKSIVELYPESTKRGEVSESIQNFPAIEILKLSNCWTLSGISNTIGYLTALKYLDLSACREICFIPSTIGNLTALETLKLSGCGNLSGLPSTIGNLSTLKNLDLSSCKRVRGTKSRKCSLVGYIPSTIGNLTALETLRLSGCTMLLEIPSTIGNMTALKDLDLSDCEKVWYIPFTIGNLTALKTLRLSGCKMLSQIPSTIGNLTALKTLNLSNCEKLRNITKAIGDLTLLEDLNLQCCTKLSRIPSTVGNLTTLKMLNLSNCKKLRSIPSTIGNLTVLEHLNLSGCRLLSEIPYTIGNLHALESLILWSCEKLRNIPSTIGNLTALETLTLSGCTMLSNIPSTISNLTALKILHPPQDVNCIGDVLDAIKNLKNFGHLNGMVEFEEDGKVYWERDPGNHDLEVLFIQREYYYVVGVPIQCRCLSLFPHLRKLSLSNLNILEIPNDLHHLEALSCLDLSGNDFEILPASIDQLSLLEELVLSHCRKLLSLPMLPRGLKYLYANGCFSLESISNVFGHSFQELMLSNCFKLDQDAQLLIQHMVCSTLIHKREVITWACLYGSELPDCFNHQSREQTLTARLSQMCFVSKPVGFVAGIVIAFEVPHLISDLSLRCSWHGNVNQACYTRFHPDNLPFHVSDFFLKSNLLLVFSSDFLEELSCDEISFNFELHCKMSHLFNCCEIKRCGIRLCFTEEL